MAFPEIQLRIGSQTVAGDSFAFNVNSVTQTFSCLSTSTYAGRPYTYRESTQNSAQFEYPSTYIAASLRDSLPSSLYEVIWDFSRPGYITIRGKSEDADLNFLNASVNNGSGSKISIVEIINADGTTGGGVGEAQDNIVINSIGLIQLDSTSTSGGALRDDFYFNNGDNIAIEIGFNTLDALTNRKVAFYYNFIEEEDEFYQGQPDLTEESFRDTITEKIQKYLVDTSGFGVNTNDKLMQRGELSLIDNGNNNYTLRFELLYYDFLPEDFVVSSDGVRFQRLRNLLTRFIFRLDVVDEFNSNNIFESTRFQDLTNFFKLCCIGNFGEVFCSSLQDYELESLVNPNTSTSYNPIASNNYIANIKLGANGSNLAANDIATLHIAQVPNASLFDNTKTFLQNINYEKLRLTIQDVVLPTTIDGNNITRAYAVIPRPLGTPDYSRLAISFFLEKFALEGQYIIWVSIDKFGQGTNFDRMQSVLLEASEPIPNADVSAIEETPFTGGTLDSIVFNYLDSDAIGDAYDHVRSFVGDDLYARFAFDNNDSAETTVTSVKIYVIDTTTGDELEAVTVRNSELNYDNDRNVNYPDSNIRKQRKVTKTATSSTVDNYEIEYGFTILEDWADFSTLVFRVDVNIQQTKQIESGSVFTGNFSIRTYQVTGTKTFESPAFNLGDYDTTKNTANEPQALRSQFLLGDANNLTVDGNGIISNPVSGIVKDTDLYVQAVFEEDNLDNLQANAENMIAWLAVDYDDSSSGSTRRIIYGNTLTDLESDSPWEGVNATYEEGVKIIKVDVDTALLEAVIDYNRLVAAFPDISNVDNPRCLKFSARLDALQTTVVCPNTFLDGSSWEFVSGECFEFVEQSQDPQATINSITSGFNYDYLVGRTLTVNYSYSGVRPEGATQFQWYTATNARLGGLSAISGATSSSYVLTTSEIDSYIVVGVTPVDDNGTLGDEVFFTDGEITFRAGRSFNRAAYETSTVIVNDTNGNISTETLSDGETGVRLPDATDRVRRTFAVSATDDYFVWFKVKAGSEFTIDEFSGAYTFYFNGSPITCTLDNDSVLQNVVTGERLGIFKSTSTVALTASTNYNYDVQADDDNLFADYAATLII